MSTPSMTATSPAGVVDGLRADLVGLTQTLWAAQSGTVLLDTVAALERLRSTLDAVVMPVVAEVDATDAAKAEGWSSSKDFLTAVTGGHRGGGAGLVRLARELTGPRGATLADLAGGRISRVQAEVVTRAVDQLPGDPVLRGRGEAVMLEHARVLDATALTRAGRHLVSVVDPDGDERAAERALAREERAAHLGRFLNIRDDGIGGVSIRGRASAEDGAMIRAALLPLAAPVPTDPGACGGTGTGPGSCGTDGCTHDGADPREHGARFLDALVEATRRLQSADLLPSSHGATPRITLTLGYLWLLHQHTSSHHNHHPAAADAGMDSGDPMSAEAARRLACDADLIPAVLGPEGQVLDVGRRQRLVTADRLPRPSRRALGRRRTHQLGQPR